MSNSFGNNLAIKSISFPSSSSICTIHTDSFKNSTIEKIYLLASLKELCDGWRNETLNLNTIAIAPKNIIFIYIDDKLILKSISDVAGPCYDSLIFARRNIKKVVIPSFIMHIDSFKFQNCSDLKSVEFSNKSEL